MISSDKYTIYTGESVLKKIKFDILVIFLIGLIGLLFMKDPEFGYLGYGTFVMVPTYIWIIALGIPQVNLYSKFGKENKYFLTVNNAFEVYKNFYLTSYLSDIFKLVMINVIVGLEYMCISESVSMFMIIKNIICILFFMSFLPFLFSCKNQTSGLIKCVVYYFVFLGCFVSGIFYEQKVWTAVMALCMPFLFVFSNKRWLKLIKEKYENGKE